MSKPQRYPEEFRIEVVKKITERNYPVTEVAARLGVSQHSLYQWIKRYAKPESERAKDACQAAEILRLKGELVASPMSETS